MMSRSVAIRRLTLALIFVFATALAIFIGSDQRNYLVIAFAALSLPLVVFLRRKLGQELILVLVALLPQFLVVVATGESGYMTTIMYTTLLSMAYLALAEGLRSGYVNREAMLTLLKRLIFAYAVVSVLQMSASLVGLPIPNLILSKGGWNYNSLAVEPSHAGRALALSMLTYFILSRTTTDKTGLRDFLLQHKLVVVAFLTSVGLTGSVTAILAAPAAIILTLSSAWRFVLAGLLLLSWPALQAVDLPALQRGSAFLSALPTMDIAALTEADSSGALRVIPMLLFLQKADPTTMEFWLGGGLGSIASYVQGELPGLGEEVVAAGFIPGYVIAFGVIGTLLFLWVFLFRFLSQATLPVVLLWSVLFATSAWNTQLFWYGLMLIRVTYHFQIIQKRQEKKASSRLRTMSVFPPRNAVAQK